ncbi:MAG: hypothetical protein ACR2LI_03595, partial [Propionibacteriaceae bacterium]
MAEPQDRTDRARPGRRAADRPSLRMVDQVRASRSSLSRLARTKGVADRIILFEDVDDVDDAEDVDDPDLTGGCAAYVLPSKARPEFVETFGPPPCPSTQPRTATPHHKKTAKAAESGPSGVVR